MKLAIQWHYQGPIGIWFRNADVNIDTDSVLWCFKRQIRFCGRSQNSQLLWYNKIKLVMPQSRFWKYCDIAKERLFWYHKIEFVNSQNISQIFKIQNNILRYQNSVLWYQTKQKQICFITIWLIYSSRIYDVIVNSVDRPDSSPIRVCTVCSCLSAQRLGIIRYLSVCVCLSIGVCLSVYKCLSVYRCLSAYRCLSVYRCLSIGVSL